MPRYPCPFLSLAAALLAATPAAFAQSPQTKSVHTAHTDFVSSDGGTNAPFTGININAFLGANTFYNAGYTGSRAVVAVVDAGTVWSGHETLTQDTTDLYANDPGSQLGQVDRHATWVGFVVNGRPTATADSGEYQRGIAYGSTLWSGAVATSFTDAGGFSITNESFTTPYYDAMQTGVNGVKANVVNSSFGYTDTTGSVDQTIELDALAAANGTTVTLSAGNSGPGADTVAGPASGYNNITVAALGTDTSAQPYSAVSSFSSRGPSDFYNPVTKQTITGVRSTVDIAAPGEELTLAYYGGQSGENADGSSGVNNANTLYSSDAAGTSFAAPTVAGGAALLVDAGKADFSTDAHATDGRVIKAILMNSADKTAGFNNGQSLVNGVVTTTQSLDYSVGAGRMDLAQAYTQYLGGTTDVPSLLGASAVQNVGWAFGQVGVSQTHNDYIFAQPLQSGSTFTGTLDWFADRTATFGSDANGTFLVSDSDNSLANLDLDLYEVVNGQNQLVAQSDSLYNNTEEFSFALPSTGSYFLRALWNGTVYGNDTSADYGIAWSDLSPAPEPSEWVSFGLGAFGLCALALRARRRASTDNSPAS